MRLGAGANVDERPALLIVANANGAHVVGSEVAFRTVQSLASRYGADTAITRLLDRTTIYVVPRANPDAAESFFGPVRYERAGNDARDDDDRDAAIDEDAPNDLNGDGLITMMRVTDPAGEWMIDPVNPQLMRRADATKGEVGRFRVMTEGLDDDKDEQFNEDGPGGTDIGRNFPHEYEWFCAGSGVGPVATNESRALAQLFGDRPNIAAVYIIGLHDTVIKPWEGRTIPGIAGLPPRDGRAPQHDVHAVSDGPDAARRGGHDRHAHHSVAASPKSRRRSPIDDSRRHIPNRTWRIASRDPTGSRSQAGLSWRGLW